MVMVYGIDVTSVVCYVYPSEVNFLYHQGNYCLIVKIRRLYPVLQLYVLQSRDLH